MLKRIKPLIIVVFSVLLILLALNNYGIWTDETYTLNMIKNSFSDIFYIEKNLDGNIFYMITLKAFISLFNVSSPKDTITLARIFSVIPIILLFIIGDRKISKLYTDKHGVAFIISMFVSNVIYYSIEIRVYSWTILFVTLAFLYFLNINESNKKKNWIIFVLCSSIAFWFHKIAVIPLGFLYVYLFFKTLKEKEVGLFFKYLILTIVICLPWVLWSFYLNIDSLSESYVVGAIMPVFSYSKITETIIYPFSTGYLYLSLSFIVFIGLIFLRWLFNNRKDLDIPAFAGMFVLPLTALSLMIFAFVSNHDYYSKYMLPSLGILFTSISIFIADDKYYKQLLAILLTFNLITYYQTFISEQRARDGFKELETYMNNEINDETLIFNFDYGKYIIDYYQFEGLKDNELIWNKDFYNEKNSLYLIQSYELDEYFNGKDYKVIKEFNISNDLFSLCELNVQ